MSITNLNYYTIFAKKHLIHYLVNIPGTLIAVFFYNEFGFLGYEHIASVILLHFSIIALDDYIDKKQAFPWYVIPMLGIAAYFFPLVTGLGLLGLLLINIRTITKSKSFFQERIEGLGMLPIGVFPFILPLGITDIHAFISPIFVIFVIDSFHKIAHRETNHKKLMWITGIISLILFTIIYVTTWFDFLVLGLVAYLPLVGFWILQNKPKKYSFIYYQIWQGAIILTLCAKYVQLLQTGF